MLDHIQKLMGALHSFIHPSNSGRWSVSIDFSTMSSLRYDFAMLLLALHNVMFFMFHFSHLPVCSCR